MERVEIERVLSGLEARLQADPDAGLARSGFWKAVAAVKRSPELVDEFADRIAAVDREGFKRWALLTVPVAVGTALAGVGVIAGLVLVALAYTTPDPWNGLLFLGGNGVLLVATHGLAHLVVGRLMGIRFTHWFIGNMKRPQPGVKTDYATYLVTPANRRAWMHASGALFTKIVPFALLPAGLIAGVPNWAIWLLVASGVLSILTDAAWSTTSSDWMKFRRERSYATR